MNKIIQALLDAMTVAWNHDSRDSPAVKKIAKIIDEEYADAHMGIKIECRSNDLYWTEYATRASHAVALAAKAPDGIYQDVDITFTLH